MRLLAPALATLLPVVMPAVAVSQSLRLTDLSLYTRLKTNLLGRTQQETGLLGSLWKHDRFSLSVGAGYSQTYTSPDFLRQKPLFTAGLTLKYRLLAGPSQFGVYTKTKHDLFSLWQQESGLTGNLWKRDRVTVLALIAYVQNYPWRSQTNSWTAGIQTNVRF